MAQLNDTLINGDCNITGNLTITTGGGKINPIVDLIYPIGSYFFSNSSTFSTKEAVQNHFGGTWVKLGDGYFVEAGSSITTHDAGLPNITGEFDCFSENNSGTFGNGAFYLGDYNHYGSQTTGDNDNPSVKFDASRCSSIYGKSTTVQPKSRTAYIYYRTA